MIRKNTQKRILFRADGNSEIGLGHIYRCLAIAERLNEDFECYFASKKPSNEIVNIIGKLCAPVVLDEFENYSVEAEELVNTVILQYNIDIVVLDGYYFDTAYQMVIKKGSKSILISIDDDQPFHYLSDVVINHAGGVREEQISKESYTKLFLGYNYLLLRKQFIQAFNRSRKIEGIHSVLICFGGADPQDFTGRMLNCLKHEPYIHTIIIIVGTSYLRIKELERCAAGYSHVKIKSNLDTQSMATIMNNIDLAIVPASTIGLEAFASRMIIVTGMTANNQQYIYDGLIKEETVVGVGDFNKMTCRDLLQKITSLIPRFNNYLSNSENKLDDNIVKLFKSLIW